MNKIIKIIENEIEKKENIKSYAFDVKFWESVFSIETPPEIIRQREISDGYYADYFELDYTIEMLNKLFPGWQTRNIQLHQVGGGKGIVITGELGCPVLQSDGTRKMIWRAEVGGAEIHFKKETDLPFSPDNVAKSAYTDWLKRAGRLFGIGWDLWENKPTEKQIEEFENAISNWEYKDIIRKRFKRCKKTSRIVNGKMIEIGADDFIKKLPTDDQVQRFNELIKPLSEEIKLKLWEKFQLYDYEQVETFLKNIENRLSAVNTNKENKDGTQ